MPIIIDVKVIPNASKTGACLDASNKLKIYLKSPPEDGKANRELIKYLAKALGTTAAAIDIIAGATSRTKKIKILLPLTYDDIVTRLGLAVQKSFIAEESK